MQNDFNDPELALTAVQTPTTHEFVPCYNLDDRDMDENGSVRETYERVKSWIRHVHLHELESGYPYQELSLCCRPMGTRVHGDRAGGRGHDLRLFADLRRTVSGMG